MFLLKLSHFRQVLPPATIETYFQLETENNNEFNNEENPSNYADKKPSASQGSNKNFILDILEKGSHIVKSKLSSLVSSVVSTKISMICDIRSVVTKKLSFLESLIGLETFKKTGTEACLDDYEAKYGRSTSISVDD